MKNGKKLMKRILALALCAVLTVSALALGGCSKEKTAVRAGALKGPTGLGILELMEQDANGKTQNDYEFLIAGAPDEITAKLLSGELDIAAIPTNLASVLYNKTSGGVQLLAINTLGVLYVLEIGDSVQSIADLEGRTLYSTGLGSTPEYALNYILAQNGLEGKVTVEYKSEHSELAALMASGEVDLCLLPQPFVTSVTTQNPDVRIALDLQQEWENCSAAPLAMACIVVRSEFAKENPKAVEQFMKEYEESVNYAVNNVEETAQLAEKYDIMNAAVAQKAIPYCNIVFISGNEMKSAAEQLFAVLLDAQPTSIGGAVPGEDFYYLGK